MNTQQIKRAKRLAEIMGMNHVEVGGNVLVSFGFNCDKPFNPEQDKALLWDLMIKYRLSVDHAVDSYYDIGVAHTVYCKFTVDADDIPAALIDCVIEINGGYDE